jgi:hypothetical protein
MSLKIPKSWQEINVAQYIEIFQLQETEFDSILDYEIEVLSILMDEDPEVFLDLDFDELNQVIDKVKWLKQQPRNKIEKQLYRYSLINIDKLKLGEFIDLEYFFSENYVINLPKICAIVYRQTKLNEWNERVFEPYDFDLEERKNEFYQMSVADVYEIIPIYLKWRENFMSVYTNLFEPVITEPDEDEELDPEDLKAEQEEKKFKRWAWEQTIYNLANEDITKFEDVLRLPVVFAFNILAMKKDLSI